MVLRALSIVLLLPLLPGCPASGGPIDPASATARDVEGWWLARDEATSTSTILGLLSDADARRHLPVEENQLVIPPSKGISVLYEEGVPEPMYVAAWSVSGGKLQEDVLADRDGASQASFATAIKALTPRATMSLESSRSASGERTYRWYERCPTFLDTGWYSHAAPFVDCPPSVTAGNSVAFDDEGNVHSAFGVFTSSQCTRATYAYVTRGCEPRRYALPNFTHSAIDVRGGVVRLALVNASAQLVLFEGPVGALSFTQTLIDNGPITAHALRFLTGAAKPTLLVRADLPGAETVTAYTLDGTTWSKRSGAQVPFPFASRMTPSGDVVFVKDFAVHRVGLDGAAVGAAVPLPAQKLAPEPPLVTADGRVQVVLWWRDLGDNVGGVGGRALGYEAVFAEWDGQRWRQVSLGLVGDVRLATAPSGPTRVIASLGKASVPTWALYELQGDRVVSTERILTTTATGISGTPDFQTTPQAAVSATGAIAFSTNGELVFTRAAGGLGERRPVTMAVRFQGTGTARLVSDDGRVDCRADCEVKGLAGERIPVRLVPEAGSAARMSCVESFNFGEDRCFLELLRAGASFTVETVKQPLERVLPVGNPGGTALTSRVSVAGERVLLQADLGPGRVNFGIGTTELFLASPTPRALVGFDRVSRTGWMTPLPEPALALQALPDGGGWVVLAVFGVVEFGGLQLGAANLQQVLRVRVGADGKATEATLLAEGSPSMNLAAALSPDGSALLAFRASSASTARVARLGVTGPATTGDLGVSAGPQAVWLDGERALVAAGTHLVALQGVTVSGTRDLPNATVLAAALSGGRALVAVSLALDGDLGGGARPAGGYLAQYDAALTLTASVATPAVAVAAFPDGAVVMTANQTTRSTAATRYDLSLTPRGPPTDLGLPNVRILSSGQDGDRLVLLGLQTGAAMFDGFRLTTDTRTWLLEIRR